MKNLILAMFLFSGCVTVNHYHCEQSGQKKKSCGKADCNLYSEHFHLDGGTGSFSFSTSNPLTPIQILGRGNLKIYDTPIFDTGTFIGF